MEDNNNGGITRTTVRGNLGTIIQGVIGVGLLMLFSGIAGFMTLGAFALAAKHPDPLSVAWAGFGAGGLLVFVGGVAFFRKGFYLLEILVRRDIDGDGFVGAPQAQQPRPLLAPIVKNVGYIQGEQKNQTVRFEVETEHPDDLQRIAVFCAINGPASFKGENFTRGENKVMTEDFWRDNFIPSMLAAGFATSNEDSRGRKRTFLTAKGIDFLRAQAGAAGDAWEGEGAEIPAQLPMLQPSYASETTTPLPSNGRRVGVLEACRQAKRTDGRMDGQKAR